MDILDLSDAPSQRFTLNIDDESRDLVFSYNQLADRWSVTVFAADVDCPLVAGRFILPGMDLLEFVPGATVLLVLDRPGIGLGGTNWYDRLTSVLTDGLPATLLVLASRDELQGLLEAPTEGGILC